MLGGTSITLWVIYEFDSAAINAICTILIILLGGMLFYLFASIVQSMSIEMLDQWVFQNYHGKGEVNEGKVITIRPAELEGSP